MNKEAEAATSEAPYQRDWRFLATIAAAANYLPQPQTHMRKVLHRDSARANANANGDGEPLNLRPKLKARTRQVGPCA